MTIHFDAASTPASHQSPFAGANLCQLTGLSIRPGGRSPAFEQDVWDFTDLAEAAAYIPESQKRLDFTKIRNPLWRTLAKEYLVALMVPGHEAVRVIPDATRYPHTIASWPMKLAHMTRWLNWLTEQGITRLAQVTEYHCETFVQYRSRRVDDNGAVIGEQPAATAAAAGAVIAVAQYGELFSSDRYRPDLHPFQGKRPSVIAGIKPAAGENKTPTVPGEILQPTLAAALYVVATLAPQIMDELQRLDASRKHAETLPDRTMDCAAMSRVIQRYIDIGQPLPRANQIERTHRINQAGRQRSVGKGDPLIEVGFRPLALETGAKTFYTRDLDRIRPLLELAVSKVGVAEPWGRNALAVTRPDGQGEVAWTEPISMDDLLALGVVLRIACVIVIAAVTGMRGSELSELAVGCRLSPVDRGNGLVRYKLASKVVKGQPHGGADDEWVVAKEPYEAAGVAEQLLGAVAGSGALLFGPLYPRWIFPPFRQWVNGPAGQRLGLAPIPDGNITLRMLRRTLAVELAYRPGGLLAAKIHLKHVSVVTTEGYAARPGGAQAKFLTEIGQEEQKRNLDIVLAEYDNARNGIQPSGPGARDLMEFFTSIDGKLTEEMRQAPNIIANDRQIRTMAARRAKTLHLGVANYCWFHDPAKALCLKLAGTPQAQAPLLNMCDSTRCPQATHHIQHRQVWEKTVQQHKTFIGKIGRGQDGERARLQAELARAEAVLTRIDASQKAQD